MVWWDFDFGVGRCYLLSSVSLLCGAPDSFSLIFFTITFLGYGYNMIPAEVRLEQETADEPLEVLEVSDEVGLSSEKISIIESMLTSWCDKGGYRDSTVNMPMLSVKLGIPRNELSLYFENYLKSSFRIWLSDIRFKEAQRMLLEECRYSNDTILQNAASHLMPISIRSSRLKRDLRQDNGEILYGKIGRILRKTVSFLPMKHLFDRNETIFLSNETVWL